MAIVQISKIQQRSGNLVDLPQLDEAEFGWASDTKRLFIGKNTPNENIEVLTGYSEISFSQIDGSVGNLSINPLTAEDGQVLTFDGTNWVNRGGIAGGLVDLGDVSNVKISGGAISYVLETDGLGNLSWAPKSTITAYIENVAPTPIDEGINYALSTDGTTEIITLDSNYAYVANTPVVFSGTGFGNISANTTYYIRDVVSNNEITISSTVGGANIDLTTDTGNLTLQIVGTVVTTTQDNFFTEAMEVTITDAQNMTELNGQSYYVDVISSNTFALFTDPALTLSVDSTNYNAYAYTSVANTSSTGGIIDVGDSTVFSLNQPVKFLGDVSNTNLTNSNTYYIKTKPSSTEVTVSYELLANGVAGNLQALQSQTGLTASMYATGGRVISSVGGGGASAAQGSNTTIQFNNNNILDGDADFTFDFGVSPKLMNLNGNANVGNLNATDVVTATRFISNVATGTTPLQVTSTTRVANLNVAYSNVTDFVNITTATTGTFNLVLTNALTGNVPEFANSALTFNALTGNLSTTLLNVTTDANIVGNLGVTANAIVNNFVSNNFANVGGNLNVTANANVTGNLNVTANANITANLASNNAAVGNLLTVGANANVTGNLNVTANANIGTNLHLTGSAFVGGNANITGTLNVTDVATFSANANVTGNLNVTGNIFGANLYQNGTRVFKYTSSNTAPVNPEAGDQWYYIADDILYSYINDGTTSQWVDIFDPSFPPSDTAATANTIAQRDLNASLTANIFYGTGVRNTGANATGNIGSSSGYFDTVFAQATSALYADLAEKFETDKVYPVGTVIVIGGEKEATQSSVSHDSKVLGVISDKPSYLMNAGSVGQPIALTGRVPCRVKGKVKRGDVLVTSDIEGVAQALDPVLFRHGCTFAKALGEWNDESEGVIEVIVGRI